MSKLRLEMLDNYTGDDLKKFNKIKKDARLHNIPELSLRVMYNRGLDTVEKMEKHLFGNLNDLHDSFLLPDCEKFCEVVTDAIKNNKHIINYTDYDVDGIGSSITCLDGINKLIQLSGSSATIDWYANNRFIEGYGITVGGVMDLIKKYPDVDLIITTDNGIVAFDAIEKCKELGIDVVITDHHQTLKDKKSGIEKLPNALAVVDPHRKDSKYPFPNMCGAGVMFKLLLALCDYMKLKKEWVYDLLDVVAMATIADIMPLLDENRIFVKEGLKLVKDERRLAFKMLRKGIEKNYSSKERSQIIKIDEELFGYTYCPMLNALGRLHGIINDAMDLFTISDEKRMEQLVDKIIVNNENRKRFTEEQTKLAIKQFEEMDELPDVLVTYDETYMEGIVGLIAGRLKEHFHRPAIAFAKNGDKLKGSARSIDNVNIIEHLLNISDELITCGGHAGAAGLSISEDNLKNFHAAILNEIQLTEAQKEKVVYIDAAIPVEKISETMVDGIEMLKPFGEKFEKPRFGLQHFIADIPSTGNPYRGSDKQTIRLLNTEGFTVLMFKNADTFEQRVESKFQKRQEIKCIGYPSVNVFNNRTSLQMIVEENFMF